MVEGNPVELPCPHPNRWGICKCGKCQRCGFQKHMSVHGGVIDKPGMVFGHEFVDRTAQGAKS